MTHSLGVGVVFAVSLASSDGWWPCPRETVWPSLRLCGVVEKERARGAFRRISRLGVESIPIPVRREVRLARDLTHP